MLVIFVVLMKSLAPLILTATIVALGAWFNPPAPPQVQPEVVQAPEVPAAPAAVAAPLKPDMPAGGCGGH